MKISTKGRYALRVMIDLAEHNNGEFISLKDISNRQEISMKYLESIISILNKAGFVSSMRGKEGGYRLAGNPDQYTVGAVLKSAEGKLVPVSCLDGEINTCPRVESCPTIEFWRGLGKVIDEYVESYTLQDFINRQNNYNI